METVAIIDFEGIGISESEARALTQRLTSEIIEIEKFTVVERSEMKRLLDEQKFQYSGCVDVSCAVEIGKLLGAKSMVVGTISKLGKSYSVDSRLIDVKTGENYVSANYTTTKDLGDLLNGMRNIAYKICEMEVPEKLIRKEKKHSSASSNINIISDPSGAEVYIDGKNFGFTPLFIDDLPPGFYGIHLHHSRYGDFREEIKLMIGEERQLSVRLNELYDLTIVKKIFFKTKMDTILNISGARVSDFYIEYINDLGIESNLPCSIALELISIDGKNYKVDCTTNGLVVK